MLPADLDLGKPHSGDRERGTLLVSQLLQPADEAFLTQSGVHEIPDCFHFPKKLFSLSMSIIQSLKLIAVSSALVCEVIGKLRFAQQVLVHLLYSISV